MLDPESLRPPESDEEATGAWPDSAPAPGPEREGGDPPTVRSGSSARRLRSGAAAATVPLPLPGDRIDSFELEEAIGVGGMGAVFRALDTRLDRHVALKILPPEQASDPEVVQRFYQEGRAAARLDNENIARVYTIDHDAKYHFIAFEYIEGTTIRQRVERNGPLPVAEAINFTLQIAGALVHAAERGVVHRDIKPSNIIVTPQGRAKLVDMGLARRFERGGDDGLTQSGMTLGTFDYISPEQARDPRDVDVRSDLYSLGCTLFHMLTGRPPFPEGTVLQKLLQHQEDAPPDVRALNPEVPPDLASILVKLMAKDRDRRYQTPEQLVRDLLTVAGALGLRSVSPEGLVWMAATHPPGWERHLVWALPVLALVLLVGALVFWGQEPPRPLADPFAKSSVTPQPAAPQPAPPTRVAGPPATAESPTAPTPVPSEVRPRDRLVDSNEDLLAHLADAPPKSVIVLADDGPYNLVVGSSDRRAARLENRDLTIKAAAGVRPVLRLAREAGSRGAKAPSAALDFLGGRVTLEGLEFEVEPGEREDSPTAAIRTQDSELTVRRCVFRRSGSRARPGRLSALLLRMTPSSDRPPAVYVDACHFGGGQVGVLAQGPADLVLRDCSMEGGAEPSVWFENAKVPGAAAAELRLRHASLLAGEAPVFRFDGPAPRVWIDDSVIAPARDAEGTLVAGDEPDTLDWRGRSNLYAKIGVFLKPLGTRPSRDEVRSWETWADALDGVRETGSATTRGRIWEEGDPSQVLAQEDENPTRAFRLASTRPGAAAVGVRQGPFGVLTPPPLRVAANLPSPRREPAPTAPTSTEPTSTAPREPGTAKPMAVSPSATESPASKAKTGSEMPEMPVMPPVGADETTPPPSDTTPANRAADEVAAAAKPADNPQDPPILRTADQLLNELNRPEGRGGTLRIAADADWELPSVRIEGEGRWVLRAEPGTTRPRIRFRPAPADPKTPTAWSFWVELRSGTLQLEGIDLVLARSDAPRQGRWAGFGVWGGADLALTNCTVTVEGDLATSAAVVIPSADRDEPGVGAGLDPSAALVRMTDSLLRSAGDLFEVAAGRRLDLELSNAVVSTGGSLVHAHGLPRGQVPETVKLTFSQVTARTVGGLVQLESAPGEPELPVADVRARDSIFATTGQGAPLFRVDGQDTLTSLSDRIKWEGHGVAYHEINTYRRDQSAQAGAVPNLYDRPSWMVAVGTKEDSPWHGNVRFLRRWDPDRDPWTLRREDVRLSSDSPASRAGADLQRVPEPPSDET